MTSGPSSETVATARILAVDDEETALVLIGEALKLAGARESRLLSNSAEAMALAESFRPDLVILDWLMEPPNGLALTRLLRAAPPPLSATRIVLLSAHSERWRIEAARDAGVDAFLAKPIAAPALARRLERTLAGPRRFLRVRDYVGPDRRRQTRPFEGIERRGQRPAGAPALQAELERRLAALAAAFPTRLAELLARLSCLDRELAGPGASYALAEARRLLHDLAGQAGSFGHLEVGRLARRLDTALATTGDTARRRALLKRGIVLMGEAAGLAPPESAAPPRGSEQAG